ncbi:hypothetical protein HOLleu_20689 [Holothuria leucospilota]|uniref:Uncharacterized protein n=1 Tax=Holothuria leucospilota TaxID=206669 RepID=A0A9Q1C1V4_HOLLE|nr:hypothetical protein HOLleu_20689 [Holothuria leucospilota]
MNLWRRTASILILLSECLLVSLGSTDNPIFISFVDTSAEVLSGVPFGLTLEATQEVTVTVGVSVCLEDVMLTIGGTMTTSTTVSFTASSSEVISNIIATPMPPTAKSRVVDFYITDITPSDGVKVGETSWLRYIINTNEWSEYT